MAQWRCSVCGYVYDPAKGDPDSGVAAGTAFESLSVAFDSRGRVELVAFRGDVQDIDCAVSVNGFKTRNAKLAGSFFRFSRTSCMMTLQSTS